MQTKSELERDRAQVENTLNGIHSRLAVLRDVLRRKVLLEPGIVHLVDDVMFAVEDDLGAHIGALWGRLEAPEPGPEVEGPRPRHSRAEIVRDELEGVLEMQGQGLRAVRRSLQLHSYCGDRITPGDAAGLGDLLEHAIEALEAELRRVFDRVTGSALTIESPQEIARS